MKPGTVLARWGRGRGERRMAKDEESGPVQAALRDLDGDGHDEVVLDNGRQRLAPARGGRLAGWSVRLDSGPERNLFATYAAEAIEPASGTALRLRVAGHQPQIAPGLGPTPPAGLVDHFLPLTTRLRDFAA